MNTSKIAFAIVSIFCFVPFSFASSNDFADSVRTYMECFESVGPKVGVVCAALCGYCYKKKQQEQSAENKKLKTYERRLTRLEQQQSFSVSSVEQSVQIAYRNGFLDGFEAAQKMAPSISLHRHDASHAPYNGGSWHAPRAAPPPYRSAPPSPVDWAATLKMPGYTRHSSFPTAATVKSAQQSKADRRKSL